MTNMQERVRELEAFRVNATGHIHALEQMVMAILVSTLNKQPDPFAALDQLRAVWDAQVDGTDAYRRSVDALTKRIKAMLEARKLLLN